MNENGKVSFGCLLMTAILVLGAHVGYKFGLPYYNYMAFQEKLFEVAEYTFHQKDEQIISMIQDAGSDYDVHPEPKRIKIEQTRDTIDIEVNYSVPVETVVFSRTLEFTAKTSRTFTR